MNWDAVAAISALIGAVGVVASLLFVGMQVRQNTRAMRAATYDSLVTSNGDWLAALIQDRELAAQFESAVEDWSQVGAEDRPRMMFLLTQLFRHWENAWFQHTEGTLAPELWTTWRKIMASYFHQPGVQEWWQLRRMAYSDGFATFLEASEPTGTSIRTTRQHASDW